MNSNSRKPVASVRLEKSFNQVWRLTMSIAFRVKSSKTVLAGMVGCSVAICCFKLLSPLSRTETVFRSRFHLALRFYDKYERRGKSGFDYLKPHLNPWLWQANLLSNSFTKENVGIVCLTKKYWKKEFLHSLAHLFETEKLAFFSAVCWPIVTSSVYLLPTFKLL